MGKCGNFEKKQGGGLPESHIHFFTVFNSGDLPKINGKIGKKFPNRGEGGVPDLGKIPTFSRFFFGQRPLLERHRKDIDGKNIKRNRKWFTWGRQMISRYIHNTEKLLDVGLWVGNGGYWRKWRQISWKRLNLWQILPEQGRFAIFLHRKQVKMSPNR